MKNLLSDIPPSLPDELIEVLLAAPSVRIECSWDAGFVTG
jgi:hypothetical protein